MISVVTPLSFLFFLPKLDIAAYDFPLGSDAKFNVRVEFDGYIPLFGGQVGKADVKMVVRAVSIPEKSPPLQTVESEIIDLKAIAFGSTLPLNKNNIGAFFPKAAATFPSTGLIKSNGADHVDMPVKLPGLDSQRLPEISYVPIVLDSDALATLKPYEFTRIFNGVPMKYKVSPGPVQNSIEKFDIAIDQETTTFEDSYGNPIAEEGAKSKVKTVLTGKGTATFNFSKHMFDSVKVETNGDSNVTNMKTGKMTKRMLKTTLTILRDGIKTDQ